MALSKKHKTPINEHIKASEVLLVYADGIKKEVLSLSDALNEAKSASLDLVQVSPSDANPIVCKLLDYGKFYLIKRKILLLQKEKQRKIPQRKSNLDPQQM